MNRLAVARSRLDGVAGLPAVLDVAWDAFEAILAVLRHHTEDAGHAFAAFVFAAGAAADGRDWILHAPSLPPAAGAGAASGSEDVLAGQGWEHAAVVAAGVSEDLARRLAAAAVVAADPRDRASCAGAARCAERICELLGGARPS